MNSTKKTARIVGALFITATGAAIVSGALLLPILETPDYLAKVSANEERVMLGALFYFVMAAAGASIVIPMYPILKKHHASMALGAVGFRLIEGAVFMVGVFAGISGFGRCGFLRIPSIYAVLLEVAYFARGHYSDNDVKERIIIWEEREHDAKKRSINYKCGSFFYSRKRRIRYFKHSNF